MTLFAALRRFCAPAEGWRDGVTRIVFRTNRVTAPATRADRRHFPGSHVLGMVASLAVALIMMFLNDAKTPANADESDKREMRAKRSRF